MRIHAGLLTGAALAACGCGSGECFANVYGVEYVDPELTALGRFKNTQPLLTLQFPDGMREFAGEKSNDDRSRIINLDGVPSGTYPASWAYSCSDGPHPMLGPTPIIIP